MKNYLRWVICLGMLLSMQVFASQLIDLVKISTQQTTAAPAGQVITVADILAGKAHTNSDLLLYMLHGNKGPMLVTCSNWYAYPAMQQKVKSWPAVANSKICAAANLEDEQCKLLHKFDADLNNKTCHQVPGKYLELFLGAKNQADVAAALTRQ